MTRVTLRGFAARKLRAILTGIAIVLGVALMAGTYILTDTINAGFANIFATANKGIDVVLSPHQALGRNVRSQVSPLTDAVLGSVRATPGVARAAGDVFAPATLLSTARKRLTGGGAPGFVTGTVPAPFEQFKVRRGRYPATADEVAIDETTATRNGLRIGQPIVVAGSAPAHAYRIAGIVTFGGSNSFGGASTAVVTLPEAQRVAGGPGRYDTIDVTARPGVSSALLRDRLRVRVPTTIDVRTGAQQAAKDTADLKHNLSFLRTFLLIFAYVALVVGAFIIFNTISITVAQRSREFGLLRTLGATRRQIWQSVVADGLILGFAGSALGLVAGIGLAPALNALFKAFGADLPRTGTILEARTVIVCLLVGTLITVAAGLFPAIRATRVPPVAALREGVEPERPRRRAWRYVVSLYLVYVVVSIAVAGKVTAANVVTIAFVLAYALYRQRRGSRPSRHLIMRGLARVVGAPLARTGITGRLAQENSMRQPGRTAITAAALMVGLGLVAFVSILASGIKASIAQAVDRSFAGDLIVESSQGGSDVGIPGAVATAVRRVPGVAEVAPFDFTQAKVRGISGNVNVTAVEPASFTRVYRTSWKQGSSATLKALGTTGVVVAKPFAEQHKLHVGQRLSVVTPTDARTTLTVRGIVSDESRLLRDLTITIPLARAAFGQRNDFLDFVAYAPGASNATVQPAVNRLLAAHFPQAKSQTAAQFKHDQAAQVNSLLGFIYVLLGLSVLISVFGIVNTLLLSIFERTRELGMLRAIGTSRRQLRRMITYESIITAVIGGIFGLVLGIGGGIAASSALRSQGFVVSIPAGTLLLLLVVAALVGLLAAQPPARRAARIDLLRALSAE